MLDETTGEVLNTVTEMLPINAFRQFTKEGDSVRGYLLGYQREEGTSPRTGKPFLGQWSILSLDEGIIRFNETIVLNRELSKVPIGTEVEIVYLGEENFDGGKRIKRFSVSIPRNVLQTNVSAIIEEYRSRPLTIPADETVAEE